MAPENDLATGQLELACHDHVGNRSRQDPPATVVGAAQQREQHGGIGVGVLAPAETVDDGHADRHEQEDSDHAGGNEERRSQAERVQADQQTPLRSTQVAHRSCGHMAPETALLQAGAQDHAGKYEPDRRGAERREGLLDGEQAQRGEEDQHDQGGVLDRYGFRRPQDNGKERQSESPLGLDVGGVQRCEQSGEEAGHPSQGAQGGAFASHISSPKSVGT